MGGFSSLGINLPLLLAFVINFIILLAILGKFLYKPVLKMLDERTQKVKESMDWAESIKRDYEQAKVEVQKQIEKGRQEAQAIIARAVQKGEALKEEARKEALKSQLQLQLTCCDMRNIPASALYDLVVQLFTSFGYFDLKEDDRLVLQRAHGALRAGGWYVLDLINPVTLARNLVPHSRKTVGDLAVHEERAFSGDRITKTITITPPVGETLSFSESVRLYGKEEILSMLEEEGFSVTDIAGNYQGEPFIENDSPRMMLFCKKTVTR